jgi:D-glycero-alpha-D-manno-heptose-7-phosphate kinase
MVISQTPLRVSLLGGGTDFPDFYRQYGGAVLTMAIDKYVYVILKDRFDEDIYINYSKKEIVQHTEEIKHDLVREAMKKSGVLKGVELTTLADIPSEGSGLGSSSSVTVGLLNAMYAHRGFQVPAANLVSDAIDIEINILGKPIGVQDQAIVGHGNLCFIEFCKSGELKVERLEISQDAKRRLASNVLLFFTNRTRKADKILSQQSANISERIGELTYLRDLAYEGRDAVLAGDFDAIGRLLFRSWEYKRRLADGISDEQIDSMYEKAMNAGALGAKVAGAGGGGFLLVYCPREHQTALRKALEDFRELPFMIARDGSKIIFNINT